FDERSRNIFYHTDNIAETQNEKIRICRDCPGALRIDSSAENGLHILAVHIPRKACSKCRETGYKWFDIADKYTYDLVLLQDRTTGEFHEKKQVETL
ncbi:MAG: histone deacetylase, partial [Deltaproteobacteria bacterium]